MSIEKNVSVLPITEKDLEWWQHKIAKLDWVFAVTYAEGAPHEYIAERTEGITKADFVRAARVIHTFGEPQKFYKSTRIYLVHDGWKYWTMDREHDDVTLINRGRVGHIYGVQNMPHTKSEFHTISVTRTCLRPTPSVRAIARIEIPPPYRFNASAASSVVSPCWRRTTLLRVRCFETVARCTPYF